MPDTNTSGVKPQLAERRWLDALLAWYFVTVWGSGFLATKIGLQYAAPFTFLTLRFIFGIACLLPIILITRPHWPTSRADRVERGRHRDHLRRRRAGRMGSPDAQNSVIGNAITPRKKLTAGAALRGCRPFECMAD